MPPMSLLQPNLFAKQLQLPPAAAHRNFLGTPFPQSFLSTFAKQPPVASADENDSGEPDEPAAVLDNKPLWDEFAKIGTEMVITKTGR